MPRLFYRYYTENDAVGVMKRVSDEDNAILNLDIEFSHLVPDTCPGDTQYPGRFGLIATGFTQGIHEPLFFNPLQTFRRAAFNFVVGPSLDEFGREVLWQNSLTIAGHESIFKRALKFPHIARSGILNKEAKRFRR
jgi:hypothetical protein